MRMCSGSWALDRLWVAKVAPGRVNQHSHGARPEDMGPSVVEVQGAGSKTEYIVGSRSEDTRLGMLLRLGKKDKCECNSFVIA